ncbi:hypothetical protein GCM10017744_101640 [Streptomyces antimycoticus]
MNGRRALTACARGFAISWLALVSITLSVLTIVSISFIPLGLGVFTTPPLIKAVRAHANRRRLLAATWSGVTIRAPYRPLPADRRAGVTGQVELCTFLLKDPATWRDLLWLQVDMTAGYVTSLLAFVLVPYGIEGSSWPPGCGSRSWRRAAPTGTRSSPSIRCGPPCWPSRSASASWRSGDRLPPPAARPLPAGARLPGPDPADVARTAGAAAHRDPA